jgi:hypothetical protein
VEPFPFQEEILEKLQAERELHGHYKNLVVAATGTGKTMIAAFDCGTPWSASACAPSSISESPTAPTCPA